MPTPNPRLTITLEPAVAACLRRLSEVTGNSQSKLIAELLEGSVPVFERVIATIEAAKTATAEIRGRLATDMETAQGRMEEQLGLVMGEFDQAAAPLLEDVEKVKRRARKASAGALPKARPAAPGARHGARVTPPSNRGVRSTANPRQTGKKGAA